MYKKIEKTLQYVAVLMQAINQRIISWSVQSYQISNSHTPIAVNKDTPTRWLFIGNVSLLLTVVLIVMLQDAQAGSFSASPTGLEKVAKDVHDIVDGIGFKALVGGLAGAGVLAVAITRAGFTWPSLLGATGVAIGAGVAPDLALSFSGAAII